MSVILKLISRFGVLWIEISGGFCRNRKCKGSWVVEAILKKGAVRRNSFLNPMYNVCVWWMGTHTTAHMEGRRQPCRVNPLLPLCGDLIGLPGLGGIWGIAQAKEKCYAFRMKSWMGYLALSWWPSFGGCVGGGALLEEGGGLLVKAHLVPVELCFLIRTIEQAVANLLSHTPITMCPSPAIPVAVTDNIGPQPETKVNLSQVKLLLTNVCECFTWVYFCAPCAYSTKGGQKRAPDLQDWSDRRLWPCGCCQSKPCLSSGRPTRVQKHWASPPALLQVLSQWKNAN